MSKKYGDYVKEFHEKCANGSGKFLMSELGNLFQVTRHGVNNKLGNTKVLMEELINEGDGHCFYHALLRYISDNKDYFRFPVECIDTGGHKYDVVANMIVPDDYNPGNIDVINEVRRKAISELRKMVYAKIDEKIEAMEKAIKDAEKGDGTTVYAGDGDEREFQAAADALKTTIIIARPDSGLFQLIHPGNDPLVNANSLDLKKQQSVLYLINTNTNHFNTLLPVVIQQESDHIPVIQLNTTSNSCNSSRKNHGLLVIPKDKKGKEGKNRKNRTGTKKKVNPLLRSPSGKLSEEICHGCDVCTISGGKRKTIKRKRRKTKGKTRNKRK
jgi:hypothetical protein